MKKFLSPISLTAALLMGCAIAPTAFAAEPVPVEVWALRNVVSNVAVSPDGKHIVLMKIGSKEGNRIIEIYKTSDLSTPLRRLDAKPMEFEGGISWVNDNFLVGVASKVVRKKVRKPEEDPRSYKLYAYNLEKNSFAEAQGNFNIIGNLPKDPDNVLIVTGRAVSGGPGVDPFAGGRPSAYYKFNLKTGSKSLILKGNDKWPDASFDADGNPVYRQGIDPGDKTIRVQYRLPGTKNWIDSDEVIDGKDPDDIYRLFSGVYGYQGSKSDDPTIAYIIDNRGADKAALYEFDLKTGKYGKKLFSTPDADVAGIRRHSNYWGGNDKLVAARYSGKKMEYHWFDQEEKALYDQFERKIPNGYQVSITSRSRDGKTMIVRNTGPKDPGSYWLVMDGKMAKLGSHNPIVKPEDLSDVEYVRYQARDGLTIPAYITKPKGAGPFPTIILPHGGPHINEVIIYDEWSQMLANNGYLVLQPQYRISTGWGKKHFDAGYGEHGLKMQDDKDDGANYLVKRGLADPNRMAMFGYSYGGYAAHVAASRTPQLYQCTIAGAAVGDARKRYYQRKNDFFPAGDEWAKRRGGLVGINPIEQVAKINIPQLLFHGTLDFRVEYFNAKDYMKEAKKQGKADMLQLLEMKGAGHTISTHYYKHNLAYYTKILDYLKNDCGPGGL